MNKNRFSMKALTLSVCLMVMWAILGTGTTLAWFTDETPTVKNSFVIGEIDLDVYYKNDQMNDYQPVNPLTPVFNDNALYEPGYTQVVYLRVENAGEIDFDYKVSVDQRSYLDSTNVYGGNIHLPAYLRFGVIFAATEPELTRKVAQAQAELEMLEKLHLNQYSKIDDVTVPVNGSRYVALIVWMPEDVGNEANYMRGSVVPRVELGLTVFAQQAGAPLEP